MTNKNSHKTTRRETFKDPYETEENLISTIKGTTKDELSKDWRIAMTQMLGVENSASRNEKTGDLIEGEEIIFAKEKKVEIEAAYDYKGEILHFEQKGTQKENYEIRVKIDEIKTELVKLAKSSEQFNKSFQNISVESLPQAPGKYHLNFFDFIKNEIQNALMNVKEAATWMNVVANKRDRRYSTLAKKYGTSFSLSGERTAATQTG